MLSPHYDFLNLGAHGQGFGVGAAQALAPNNSSQLTFYFILSSLEFNLIDSSYPLIPKFPHYCILQFHFEIRCF